MPEYLAPGVFVEEVSFRAKSIEGVSTSTTGFVGPTRRGPAARPGAGGRPPDTLEVLTSFADFQRIYGGFADLAYQGERAGLNYLAHAVRAYFDNGGSRLYVARVFAGDGGAAASAPVSGEARFVARFAGAAGNGTLRFNEHGDPVTTAGLGRLPTGSVIRTGTRSRPASGARIAGGRGPFTLATDGQLLLTVGGADVAVTLRAGSVTASDVARAFAALANPSVVAGTDADGNLTLTTVATGAAARIAIRVPAPVPAGTTLIHDELGFADDASGAGTAGSTLTYYTRDNTGAWKDGSGATLPGTADALGVEVVTLNVLATDGDDVQRSYEGLGVHPDHPRYLGAAMAVAPTRRSDKLEQLFAFDPGASPPAALTLLRALQTTATITLTGGHDGNRATGTDYETALQSLAAIEDISIVAAPGSSADDNARQAVHNALISHAETRRAYRIAVLDSRRISTMSEAREDRAPLDSTRAALYAPWVVVPNPLYRTGDDSRPREIALPPSGFVSGVYARTDVLRGVWKAPANEIVRGALRYDIDINFAQQETLNPIGINCLRSFPNRGNRVWGARTISSDPEWKYVSVRRYFNYLERSIDIGTQWAVFEPNNERLWANVRETAASFLVNEWRSGALLGSSPKEAFFVRCDRSTMDQNDLDNGRLVCLIGVAVVKPAEFVIFRIGQKTAEARS